MAEDTLKTEKIQIERKTFVFTLKENPRGRFLRITEDVGGRRDTIIIPAPGLEDFRKVVEEMAQSGDRTPSAGLTDQRPQPTRPVRGICLAPGRPSGCAAGAPAGMSARGPADGGWRRSGASPHNPSRS
jgi:hypothetical protein